MRHVGWKGVILETVVALLIGKFLPQVMPDIYAMIAYEQTGRGTTVMTTESQTARSGSGCSSWSPPGLWPT